MSQESHEDPFSEAQLDSPEYREKLLRKLNCLIAVLEVATAKVKKSLAGPHTDTDRLTRIRTNLQSTLDVCLRARAALERREALPQDLPENLRAIVRENQAGLPAVPASAPARARKIGKAPIEVSSESERLKFEKLNPIARADYARVDLDELGRQLQF